ncbi:MAG TPA: neutral zinc metallopeptidase [Longimicrobiales bacterium]|nr:neutral zinc metallopeptidase [Longimicrobiales bacterium]
MRWSGGRRSSNVEDRRGMGTTLVGGGIGVVVLALVAMLFGVDPGVILSGGGEPTPATSPAGGAPTDEMADFVSVVLGDTEDTWSALFAQMGRTYEDPTLVLFSGATATACGTGQSAAGPFYCPLDHKVYIDLSFYRELRDRFQAPGDFAEAYVIAHEVGHHVQTLLGVTDRVEAAQRRASREEANALSVRTELQADCYAGVWANRAQQARNILEPGDVEEALNAAAAIGDDRLQHEAQGYVVPESFTHGSSEQRVRWFRRGFESGEPARCDTFGAGSV